MDREQAALRFVVGVGLERLARWLRLLGYDTLYLRGDLQSVACRAQAEDRILLTKKNGRVQQPGLSLVVVHSSILEEQLVQVVEAVNLRLPGQAPRCMDCNQVLEELTTVEALRSVPPHVAQTQSHFQRCPACNKVYWPGTRYKDLQMRLERASGGQNL